MLSSCCATRLTSELQRAEIADAVEGRVIGVVVIVSTVDCRSAQIEQIIALDEEIDVLEADELYILIAVIVQIGSDTPMIKIIRNHQRKQVACAGLGIVIYAGGDSVVSA